MSVAVVRSPLQKAMADTISKEEHERQMALVISLKDKEREQEVADLLKQQAQALSQSQTEKQALIVKLMEAEKMCGSLQEKLQAAHAEKESAQVQLEAAVRTQQALQKDWKASQGPSPLGFADGLRRGVGGASVPAHGELYSSAPCSPLGQDVEKAPPASPSHHIFATGLKLVQEVWFAGDGILFDVLAHSRVHITGIQCFPWQSADKSAVRVFVHAGTVTGTETTEDVWREVFKKNVGKVQKRQPIPIDLLPIRIEAGERCAVYLCMGGLEVYHPEKHEFTGKLGDPFDTDGIITVCIGERAPFAPFSEAYPDAVRGFRGRILYTVD